MSPGKAILACVLAACVEHAPAQPAVDAGTVPVACDGALCATDNGSACNATSASPGALAGVALVVAALARRRRCAR
jgi:uncharacterized protein (TIGR03382 family)